MNHLILFGLLVICFGYGFCSPNPPKGNGAHPTGPNNGVHAPLKNGIPLNKQKERGSNDLPLWEIPLNVLKSEMTTQAITFGNCMRGHKTDQTQNLHRKNDVDEQLDPYIIERVTADEQLRQQGEIAIPINRYENKGEHQFLTHTWIFTEDVHTKLFSLDDSDGSSLNWEKINDNISKKDIYQGPGDWNIQRVMCLAAFTNWNKMSELTNFHFDPDIAKFTDKVEKNQFNNHCAGVIRKDVKNDSQYVGWMTCGQKIA